MPELTVAAGRLAGLLSLAAFVPYIVAILRGQTRPNRATWWIWTTNGLVLGASYYSSGAENTIWVPVSYVVGPMLTALLSLRYGEGGWSAFDRTCLAGAGTGLALWWWFNSPEVALVMALAVDFAGALPTIRKAYRAPETEDRTAWALFIAGNTVNLLAVEAWRFAIAVYAVYMFLASGTIALLVLKPRTRRPA
ncbi:MAG TPA: hypothetical protein DCP38_09555 [Acidobacteria bacterium]|mgnify:FL=1|jgi:hypothetical protein|nr:hypothetical protein [Acidobacteriota bacterium]MDP6373721.1 hypothetical protein [Vicinamibacterales bacterium]HAK55712.1 hypothetical protein [Acidobacteriota bacterium]|tara:strand:- start:2037 stop:2618 length:582 start_codon:yes stop_codon:yes gene_type:complete